MSRPAIDITGQVFGRLTVLERAEYGGGKILRWRCVCACGSKTVVSSQNLREGKTRSCGCLRRVESVYRVKRDSARERRAVRKAIQKLTLDEAMAEVARNWPASLATRAALARMQPNG